MAQTATAYVEILKYDEQTDGSILVYGKATDDTLDSDAQICDPAWLDRAMPDWFKYGNIREQHSNIAAGVATEYERKKDGHYITAHVVDDNSVKKVKSKVLKGFSIGIRAPRVVKDTKAIGGRIVDGTIVEVSLVDRPANPACVLTMAKTDKSGLVQVPQMVKEFNEDDHPRDERGRFTSGGSSVSGNDAAGIHDGVITEHGDKPTQEQVRNEFRAQDSEKLAEDIQQEAKILNDGLTESWVSLENSERDDGEKAVGFAKDAAGHFEQAAEHFRANNSQEGMSSLYSGIESIAAAHSLLQSGNSPDDAIAMQEMLENARFIYDSYNNPTKAYEIVSNSKKFAAVDIKKFDQAAFDTARQALATLIQVEAAELATGADETHSLSCLLAAVHALFAWHEGEAAGGETTPILDEESEMIEMADTADTTEGCNCKGCKECAAGGGCDSKMCKAHMDEKSATIGKCLECGCHQPAETHGRDDVTTATVVSSEVKDFAKSESFVAVVTDIVKGLLPTTNTGGEDVATKADASERIEALEAELAQVKALAAPTGPRRMGVAGSNAMSDVLTKAAVYRAKADATNDAALRKGYLALADELTNSEK